MEKNRLLIMIIGLACATHTALAEPLSYKGFTVKLTPEQSAQEAIKNSLQAQMDMVLGVNLKPEIVSFFRTVPIQLSDKMPAGKGKYTADGVVLPSKLQETDYPYLLHELLHAYLDRVMKPQGQLPKLTGFYNRAVTKFAQWRKEDFLTDQAEYFAWTGSIYLYKKIQRPPFDRETIKKNQPLYYKFLGKLFGVVH